MKKINIALVGLGFGGAFAEIYREHPNVNRLVLFDTNEKLMNTFTARLRVEGQSHWRRYCTTTPSMLFTW